MTPPNFRWARTYCRDGARRIGAGSGLRAALHRARRVSLLLFLVSGACFILTASAAELPGATTGQRWPALAEVLKRWDNESLEKVQRAAEAGELTAQHYLGYCNGEGVRVPQDSQAAIQWYERAGKAGYLPSLSNIGFLYQRGKGLPQDYEKAAHYYRMAGEQGYASALAYLGCLYRDGHGVPQDYAQAMRHFRQAADGGNTMAMVEVGRLYRYGHGVPQDNRQSRQWFEKAIHLGDSLGELNLGLLYEDEGNSREAVKWYREAADHGRADAMFKLHWVYEQGLGTAPDPKQSAEWLQRGADAGSATAQCALGYHHQYPEDRGPSNMPEAVRWYQRAAAQGHSGGQYHLADCYLKGKGVELDEERGLELMRAAADQGQVSALRELAGLYAQGVGEPRSANDTPLMLFQAVVRSQSAEDDDNVLRKWACEQIISRHVHGLGTERDLIAAARWYCCGALAGMEGFSLQGRLEPKADLPPRAAFTGSPDRGWVMISLPEADIKENGRLLRMLSLYLRASNSNKPEVPLQIAEMYATGRDAPSDPVAAWAWLQIAAGRGAAAAQARITEATSHLSAEQLEKAQRLHTELGEELRKVSAAIGLARKA